MERKIRVGAVSYLNTKPLIYGIENGALKNEVDLEIDYPARIAQALVQDRIDLGLIPVAAIPLLNESHIVSDYCIAADGKVASVCLFSQVPLREIKSIYLDYQSRTSVSLLKLLCRDHWHIQPEFLEAGSDYIEKIHGETAGLIIGDRALRQRSNFSYIYDLATGWKEITGLPFVFAAWVSNKVLSPAFIESFNEANAQGLSNLEAVISQNPCDYFDLHVYYTRYISYTLDEEKRKALKLFLSKISS